MAESTRATIIADIEESYNIPLSNENYEFHLLNVCHFLGYVKEFKDMRKAIINTLCKSIGNMSNEKLYKEMEKAKSQRD